LFKKLNIPYTCVTGDKAGYEKIFNQVLNKLKEME
jgi:hypothetical protein